MSEEEIFKILEEACILDPLCYEVDCLNEKELQAIRGLVDLYKQEKEKNKKIEAKLGIVNWAEKTWSNILDEKYISKDKITEKIKEIEKKDKIINSMSKYIAEIDNDDVICNGKTECDENCNVCIKQYFENKANEEAE